MWNWMRFQDLVKFSDFAKADPVARSLNAWVGIQCFRHFKSSFVNLMTLKGHQIDN